MKKKHLVLLALYGIGLIVSSIKPHDYFTWILEVFPAIIGGIVLIAVYNKFKFTYLVYCCILLHCFILFTGGHYTYAQVPLFDWVRDTFHQSRNNFDKLGHFAQGFVPALLVREILLRKKIVEKKGWLAFLSISVCMMISALYELLEWMVAVLSGTSADAFLGTQGDVWDTQSDMMFALIGAISAIITLSSIHDQQIALYSNTKTNAVS